MKLNISDPKTAKSYMFKADDRTKISLIGKSIKNKINLDFISKGLKGKITGGSNKQGFPMLGTLEAENTKKILVKKGIGFKTKRKGERRRRRFAGKKINKNTEQVNIKLIKGDSKKLEKALKKEDKEKKDKK